MKRCALWATTVVLLVASMSRAQDKALPTLTPAPAADAAAAPAPATAAPATATPQMGPAVPVPTYYPDAPCTARRHPLLLWLTYVPSRRPYFDGHLCQKAPNIQAPLYDYFPCIGEGCYPCGTTQPWYPCGNTFCKGTSCAAKGAP